MTVEASGVEQGRRQLNGIQTTGRERRNLSEPAYGIVRSDGVPVVTRDARFS